ncbi:FxDxF family PEP-CTERM protein [Methyloversatilis sp. XJ19-13]|uniref:FxDxF family PEP-CTERM protein n=1 Tax=Methyloversatilis sp. XJ19-13 TaxID=2963430 RepID=UPI00211B9040|nr:FxDxF family PEP-CTERM protein [Methyloversatilis sp. XJ19-13]
MKNDKPFYFMNLGNNPESGLSLPPDGTPLACQPPGSTACHPRQSQRVRFHAVAIESVSNGCVRQSFLQKFVLRSVTFLKGTEMKKSLLAVAVTGLFAVSGAQAATDWGVHDSIETAIPTIAAGAFSEIFEFSLTSVTSLTTSISSVEVLSFLNISDGIVYLYKDMGATDAFVSAYGFGSSSFTASSLAAGDYYYKVTGTATGSGGGVFALVSTTAPIAVVPEADTYLMMLAGLGMIGLMAKRRMS